MSRQLKARIRASYGENHEYAGQPDPALTAKCENGAFVGQKEGNTLVFRGIPFALPPTGPRRWKRPEPVQPDDRTFEAYYNGKTPIQTEWPSEPASYYPQGEDCLYLNIWMNADREASGKAVMVFFHGGAYGWGGTADPMYDGKNLIDAHPDIVLVTVEYRLGLMGFVDFSELPGGEEVTEVPEETEAPATEAPTEVPTEATTEAPTEYLRELEILSDTMRTMTYEEHIQIIYAGTEDYRQNGPARLDREKYLAKFRAAADTEALNTPELKSYIYDIMLNSLHYFDTISGHHTFISVGNDVETDFGFDQVNHYSWEEEKNEATGASMSVYNYDGFHYHIDNPSMTYQTSVSSEESIGFNVGTNDWLMLNTEGENISCIQPDSSLLGLVNSTGFAPQIPQSHLHDLSAWQILSVTEVNGMECAEIEGDWWKGHYKLYVDLHHGFLMKYDNSDGDHYELTDLHIDEPVEKRTFDPEGYSGTDIYGNPT